MKSIESEKEYDKLLKEFKGLMACEPGSPQSGRFEELADALEAYEDIHYDFDPPGVVDALKFRMEHGKLNQSDVARIAGIPRSRVSEILSGKREPSKDIIRRLNDKLDIPLEHLLGVDEVSKTERTTQGARDGRRRVAVADNHS